MLVEMIKEVVFSVRVAQSDVPSNMRFSSEREERIQEDDGTVSEDQRGRA